MDHLVNHKNFSDYIQFELILDSFDTSRKLQHRDFYNPNSFFGDYPQGHFELEGPEDVPFNPEKADFLPWF